MDILFRGLTIRGFNVYSFVTEFGTALNELAPLVKKVKEENKQIYYFHIIQGDLKFKETVFEGFEKMPKAFVGLFKGDNTGKAVVKASNYP